MAQSMTGYASRAGGSTGWSWVWEIRSVNGRGRDIRLRLPEGLDGLEAGVRAALGARVARGNVTVSLRLSREGPAGGARVDPAALGRALAQLGQVAAAAAEAGMPLAPVSAAEVLALPGVLAAPEAESADAALLAALRADFDAALDAFLAARATEGAALTAVIAGQLDRIAALTRAAAALAEDRRHAQAESLRAALARVADAGAGEGVDPGRVAQELAMIAVKSDITEEIDRLDAHVAAARALLSEPGPVGRKLDFLTQEFNREANTLCSKAGFAPLTAVGLDLKTVIDQMREQVQNLE